MSISRVFLLLIFVVSSMFAGIDWVYTLHDAKEKSANSKKPIMVFAATTSCPYCNIMKEVVFDDADVVKYVSNNFVAFLLYPRGGEYPKNANIRAVPTLLFYDVNENKIAQNIEGMQSPSELIEMLKVIKK